MKYSTETRPGKISKRIGVLYSGGLDSAALTVHLLRKGFEIWPIYIQCGLGWEKQEIHFAKKFIQAINSSRIHELTVARLLLENAYDGNWSKTGKTPGLRSRDEAVFLPARNLLLTIKAFLVLASKNVTHLALATLDGNPFPDANKLFFRSLETILSNSFKTKIHIHTPFRSMRKKEIIRNNRYFPIHLSMSCIKPSGNFHCGRCNKCAERRKAYLLAGVWDKTVYKR